MWTRDGPCIPGGSDLACVRHSESLVLCLFGLSFHLQREAQLRLQQGVGADSSLSVEASWIRGLHLPRIRQWLLEQTAKSCISRRVGDLEQAAEQRSGLAGVVHVGPHDGRRIGLRRAADESGRHTARLVVVAPGSAAPLRGECDPAGTEEITIAPILTLGTGQPLNALLTTDALSNRRVPDFRAAGGFRAQSLQDRRQHEPRRPGHENNTGSRRPGTFAIRCGELQPAEPYESGTGEPYYTDTYGRLIESLPARQVQLLMQLEF